MVMPPREMPTVTSSRTVRTSTTEWLATGSTLRSGIQGATDRYLSVPLRLNVGRTDGVLPEEIDHRRLRKSSEMKNVSKVLTSLFAIAALCMGLATSAGASTNSKPWTGLGATLSNWKLAHPANNTACTKGAGCYGPSIGQNNPSGQKAEFIGVELRNNRVSSFDFATGVVPASTAKSEVLKLLPSDTKTTASWVEHDSTGDTCLMWNLSSKTLEGWLGSKIDPEWGNFCRVGKRSYESQLHVGFQQRYPNERRPGWLRHRTPEL